jgi:hypothetical protein
VGEGPQGGLHLTALPSISIAAVRTGVGVRPTICPCGNFGWVGTPYAFNVVSRTLDIITGRCWSLVRG